MNLWFRIFKLHIKYLCIGIAVSNENDLISLLWMGCYINQVIFWDIYNNCILYIWEWEHWIPCYIKQQIKLTLTQPKKLYRISLARLRERASVIFAINNKIDGYET